MRLFALLGRGFLLLATMAFLTGVSLFVIGAYLMTWPLMRVSPSGRRLQAVSDVGVALFGLARVFGDFRPSPPKSAPCGDPSDRGTM